MNPPEPVIGQCNALQFLDDIARDWAPDQVWARCHLEKNHDGALHEGKAGHMAIMWVDLPGSAIPKDSET